MEGQKEVERGGEEGVSERGRIDREGAKDRGREEQVMRREIYVECSAVQGSTSCLCSFPG